MRISLILFLLSFALLLSAQVRTIPELPEFNFTPAQSISEQRLQDLEVFQTIININASFSETEKNKAFAKIDKLKREAEVVSELEYLLKLHEIYALSGNAHDEGRLALFPRKWGSLPFRGYWFEDEYRILRVLPGFEYLLGARITHLDGRGISKISKALNAYVSGSNIYFRSVSGDALLTTPAVLNHLGFIESPEQVEITLIDPSGKEKNLILSASRPGSSLNPSTASGRLLFPGFQLSDWTSFQPQNIPLYLSGDQPLSFPFIYEELGDQSIPYVQFRQNSSTEAQDIRAFIKEVYAAIGNRKFPFMIIDLRLNQGGDMLTTQKFFSSLDQYLEPDGIIYVILGNRTFSAGIIGAGFIKNGNSNVTFIGEDIGDNESFYSEIRRVSLPNTTELKFTYSAARHDVSKGCDGPECYWWYFENTNPKVGPIQPDIYVPNSFSAYSQGLDPVLLKISSIENIDLTR